MTKETQIALVVDDNEGVRTSWKQKLDRVLSETPIKVETLDVDDFMNDISELENRRESVRANPNEYKERSTTHIDNCTILIVDFDLYDAFRQRGKPEMTAESVAYFARCFSRCGYIVGVNRGYTNKVFDLSLRDHPQYFTDVDIPGESLASPGLWDPRLGGRAFRPWYWPSILKCAQDYEACVKSLDDSPATPIVRSGLSSEDIKVLQLDALESIMGIRGQGKTSQDILALTKEEIAESAVHLEHSKDNVPKIFESRVAAARIRKWLHHVVLSGQDPISDLPHVIARIPGLAKSYSEEVLNAATSLDAKEALEAFGVDLRNFVLAAENQIWWPALVLNWRKLLNDRAIVELQMKTNRPGELVFCEDISGFLPRAKARLFRSDVLSAYDARFVSDPQKTTGGVHEETIGVDYEPPLRFSL